MSATPLPSCENCEGTTKRRGRKFCSRECYQEYRYRAIGKCAVCSTQLNLRAKRFCSQECYDAYWRQHVQEKMSQAGHRVLAELHASGRDPRHGEEQQESRREKVAASNREKPRLVTRRN